MWTCKVDDIRRQSEVVYDNGIQAYRIRTSWRCGNLEPYFVVDGLRHALPRQGAYACAGAFYHHHPSLETHNNAESALESPCRSQHCGNRSEYKYPIDIIIEAQAIVAKINALKRTPSRPYERPSRHTLSRITISTTSSICDAASGLP